MELQKFLFFALLCLIHVSLLAQPRFGRDPLKVGLSLSGTSYIGDMSESHSLLSRVNPGGNLSLQTENTAALKFQVNGGFGKFTEQFDGDPPITAPHIEPTTFVETTFFYGDLRLKYRFFPQARIHPYISIGAGILFFTPRDQNGKFLKPRTQTRLEDESYSATVPQIPGTVGIQGKINRNIVLGLEYTYRFVPTDYLDNIGQLGSRNGFDSLHGLHLGLYFILKPQDEIPVVPSTL